MILNKNLKLLRATHFKISDVKREDVVNYPDDINQAFNTDLGFGGYLEKRHFYKEDENVIHTGLDVFSKENEIIIAPFNGFVSDLVSVNPIKYQVGSGSGYQLICWHSFFQVAKILGKTQAQKIIGNYKYIRIIYSHIKIGSKLSLGKQTKFVNDQFVVKHRFVNYEIKKGMPIAFVASRYENGGWPPHIHIEASLHNQVQQIVPSTINNIVNHSLVGVIKARDQNKINDLKLIDPKVLLGFNDLKAKIQVMDLQKNSCQQNIITINKLNFSYEKTKPILRDLNLNIKTGELVSILGPSGSGKTTLLNLIAGFLDSKNTIHISNNYKSHNIGFVFQDNLVYETLSVYKNIWLSAINSPRLKIQTYFEIWKQNVKSREEHQEIINLKSLFKLYYTNVIKKSVFTKRFNIFKKNYNAKYQPLNYKKIIKFKIQNLLQKLHLDAFANQKPPKLSGGQLQRLAIAKAIIKKPQILIMDEPLNSLDENIKDTTRDLIWKLQKELQITLIFVTHNQKEAMLISDRIIILKDGKLMQYDTPSQIYNNPKNAFVANFIGWPKINLIASDKQTKTFVRPNDIVLKKSAITKNYVSGKRFVDQNKIYNINYNGKDLRVVSNLEFAIGDKVKLHWDKKDEKIFKHNP